MIDAREQCFYCKQPFEKLKMWVDGWGSRPICEHCYSKKKEEIERIYND